jgi:hypothetical protein
MSASISNIGGSADNKIYLFYLAAAIFATATAFTFLHVRNSVLRILFFVVGILIGLLMMIPFVFVHFSYYTQFIRETIVFAAIASLLYLGVCIWSLFKNKVVKASLLGLFAAGYLLLLTIDTLPFFKW